jgi:hypothetical protein
MLPGDIVGFGRIPGEIVERVTCLRGFPARAIFETRDEFPLAVPDGDPARVLEEILTTGR